MSPTKEKVKAFPSRAVQELAEGITLSDSRRRDYFTSSRSARAGATTTSMGSSKAVFMWIPNLEAWSVAASDTRTKKAVVGLSEYYRTFKRTDWTFCHICPDRAGKRKKR